MNLNKKKMSGHAYRKKALERRNKEEKLVKQTAKIDSFLKKNNDEVSSSTKLNDLAEIEAKESRTMGPRCSNPRNVSMTAELAVKLLEVTNAIRSKLALGLEKGIDAEDLPRAYGMFKLHWDNELATFAQVLANQCVLRHDLCRATKRFSDPGQTAGLIRFSSPDWIPVSKAKGGHSTEPGLTPSKVTYAVTQALKSWYNQKSAITPAMIKDYPDWSLYPNKQNGRLYLEMIHGPATHMGCGISAYAEYAFYDNKAPLNYNSMQVICNFSSRPKKHQTVYNTEPDPELTPKTRCGCPNGAVEDDNCLCTHTQDNNAPKELNCDGINCEQSVILLPIVTVEDAPAHLKKPGTNIHDAASSEFLNSDYPQTNNSKKKHSIVKLLNNLLDNKGNIIPHPPNESHGNTEDPPKHNIQSNRNMNHNILSSAITTSFQANDSIKFTSKDFKKDVATRKDFSQAKYLVNSYMESLKNISNLQSRFNMLESNENKANLFLSVTDIPKRDNTFIIGHYDNNTLASKNNEIDNEESRDVTLMTLLDILEDEIQHTELIGNRKEYFYAKIRKIYDYVAEKSPVLSFSKSNLYSDSNTENEAYEKFMDLNNNHQHESSYQNNLKESKLVKTDVSKTIDDILKSSNNDFKLNPNNLYKDDSDGSEDLTMKTRRNKYNTRIESIADYDFRRRDNFNKNIRNEKLSKTYKNSYNAYNNYRHPQYKHLISKDQDYLNDDFNINQLNNGGIRKNNILNRNYHKYRDANSFENTNKNYYKRHQILTKERIDDEDDVLNPRRRKFYRDRLENLERKLQNARSRKYRNEGDRHRRPLQKIYEGSVRRFDRNGVEQFDTRDRWRYIHGY